MGDFLTRQLTMLRERIATFSLQKRLPWTRRSTSASSESSYYGGNPFADEKDNSVHKGSHSGKDTNSQTLLGSGTNSKLPKSVLLGFPYPQPVHHSLADSTQIEQRRVPPPEPPQVYTSTQAPTATAFDTNGHVQQPAPSRSGVVSKFHEEISDSFRNPPVDPLPYRDTGHRLSLVREDPDSESSNTFSADLSRVEEMVNQEPGPQEYGTEQSRSSSSEANNNSKGAVGSWSSSQSSLRNGHIHQEMTSTQISLRSGYNSQVMTSRQFPLRNGHVPQDMTTSQQPIESEESSSDSTHEYFRNAGPLIRPTPPVSHDAGAQASVEGRPISYHFDDTRPYNRGGKMAPTDEAMSPTNGTNREGPSGQGLAHVDGIGDTMGPVI